MLLLSLFANAVTNLFLAFATNYSAALIIRIVAGLLVAGQVVARSAATDMTNSTNRTGVFTLINVGQIFGMIIGPSIGGFLSRPN